MHQILSENPIILRRQRRKKIKTQDHWMFFVVDSFQDTFFYKSFANCLSWTFVARTHETEDINMLPHSPPFLWLLHILFPPLCSWVAHVIGSSPWTWIEVVLVTQEAEAWLLEFLFSAMVILGDTCWEASATRWHLNRSWLTAWTWEGILWTRNKVMYFIYYYSLLWANIWLLNTSNFLPWN